MSIIWRIFNTFSSFLGNSIIPSFFIFLTGGPGKKMKGSKTNSKKKIKENFDSVAIELMFHEADDNYLQGNIKEAERIYRTIKNKVAITDEVYIKRKFC